MQMSLSFIAWNYQQQNFGMTFKDGYFTHVMS